MTERMNLRVLQIGNDASGAMAGYILTQLGADVSMVEDTRGTTMSGSARRAFFDRGKSSILLDFTQPEACEVIQRLCLRTDLVLDTLGPDGLERIGVDPNAARALTPPVVIASISPLGRHGPRSRWVANDFILQAMGGVVASTGWDDGPPQALPEGTAEFSAGLLAAACGLAAVYGVRGGAPGVHFDISTEEAMGTHWTREVGRYIYGGLGLRRGSRSAGLQGFPHTAEAADGYIFLLALRAEWEALAHFLGLDEFITSEWSDPATRAARWDEIAPHFKETLKSRGKYEWFATAAAHGYTFAPVDAPGSILESPQLAARGFLRSLDKEHADLIAPVLPFRDAVGAIISDPAPRPGMHSREILTAAGFTETEIAQLQSSGVLQDGIASPS